MNCRESGLLSTRSCRPSSGPQWRRTPSDFNPIKACWGPLFFNSVISSLQSARLQLAKSDSQSELKEQDGRVQKGGVDVYCGSGYTSSGQNLVSSLTSMVAYALKRRVTGDM